MISLSEAGNDLMTFQSLKIDKQKQFFVQGQSWCVSFVALCVTHISSDAVTSFTLHSCFFPILS